MNLEEISFSSSSPQLSHSLDKGRALDIPNCASQLDYAHIGAFFRIVNRNSCHSLNPILHGIREMWYNLDSFAQIVSSTFPLDDMLVDLPRCDVVLAGKGDIEVSLVVAQIQVDFSTVVQNEDFAMPMVELELRSKSRQLWNLLGGSYGSSIDIHVRINLD